MRSPQFIYWATQYFFFIPRWQNHINSTCVLNALHTHNLNYFPVLRRLRQQTWRTNYQSINNTAIMWTILTRSKMICDMVAFASTIIVAVLSSRISFSSGVGSWLSSSMRTDSVSLEMRNCRRSCSRFSKPAGGTHTHADTHQKKKKKTGPM